MRILAAALALLAPALAFAGAVDDFLAFSGSARSATARFEQQVFDSRGKLVDSAAGTFAFSRPDRFRWAYDRPSRTLLVADGARLWIHDEDLNQVTVRPLDRALGATPASLLAGRADVTAAFTLREAGEEGGLAWLEAVPKAKDSGFDRVRIGMKGRQPVAMQLEDSLGGRTALRFADFRANAPVEARLFAFTPPAGADVLDESKAGRGPR